MQQPELTQYRTRAPSRGGNGSRAPSGAVAVRICLTAALPLYGDYRCKYGGIGAQ